VENLFWKRLWTCRKTDWGVSEWIGLGSDQAAVKTYASFASSRQTVFTKCKKFTSYCIAKEVFINFYFVFEASDRILTSFVKIPFRLYMTQYHRVFRPLKMAPLLCPETPVTGHKMARYRTLYECKLQLQNCENLKTGKTYHVWDQYQKASNEFILVDMG
jgi:hypothetical protein